MMKKILTPAQVKRRLKKLLRWQHNRQNGEALTGLRDLTLVKIAQEIDALTDACPGEAHTNAHIDHCAICLGGPWGRVVKVAQ